MAKTSMTKTWQPLPGDEHDFTLIRVNVPEADNLLQTSDWLEVKSLPWVRVWTDGDYRIAYHSDTAKRDGYWTVASEHRLGSTIESKRLELALKRFFTAEN